MVLVHPRGLTVHEVGVDGMPSGGNGRRFAALAIPMTRSHANLRVTRSEARAMPASHDCADGGCRAARDPR